MKKISRRQFVQGSAQTLALTSLLGAQVAAAQSKVTENRNRLKIIEDNQFDLEIAPMEVNFTGKKRTATCVNQSLPGPVLRWKEGQEVTLKVTNKLKVKSSIHWHGMILPTEMDGVPGLSFDGIEPGESFIYKFKVQQNGTYWYHSHSGFQEQTGVMGAIVIDPIEPEPFSYDKDYVVMLSDWSDENPHDIYANLKKMSHYYNLRERTVGDTWQEIKDKGINATWKDRQMWNQMRMSDRDISDVTGATYTYLMNGNTPDKGWFGGFNKGEKVRLRVINASAMTLFDVRIPGLKMTVVAADGQLVQPVEIDEFRIGVAETYDLIIEPTGESYCLFAQDIDRTGYALGFIGTDEAFRAPVPAMDPAPVLTHQDMGMSHASMGHSNMGASKMDHSKMNHEQMDHAAMGHSEKPDLKLGLAGFGTNAEIAHSEDEQGPGVDMQAEILQSGLADPGVGLRDHLERYGRKVLNYADLKNYYPTQDKRQPSCEIQLHLTGNMNRYMWSFNGKKFADAKPLKMEYGERLRIVLVNDTMMTHPVHLHGVWSELETGDAKYIPKKHTVIVQPGSSISYLVTADAKGRWAYHCHLMYHMPGMMREVRIGKLENEAAMEAIHYEH